MAIVHRTTLVPSKVEILAAWLPRQPWYGGSGVPRLDRVGGFRLDDPAGEVGLEFLIAHDGETPYFVPMSYRGAALDGGDLVGTMEHGVLGLRYAYDGVSDPVLTSALSALVRGEAEPQAQSQSDTPDPTVRVGVLPDASLVDVVRVLTVSEGDPVAGEVSVPWRLPGGGVARGVVARAK